MLFTKQKLERRVTELGWKRYFGHQCIAPFTSMEGQLSPDEHYHCMPERIEGEPFGINDLFIGRDRYLWLDREVTLLPQKEGCEVVGLFNFGDTGHGGNNGFESLLYVNGEPFQGVDTNHGEEFYPSVDRAHEIMISELEHLEKNTKITVNAIGHTHIDVAWLWRLKHTREKAQRSFATVLRLMEQYDEYVFLQTQPQLYQYIKEDCPKMYEKIKAKVAEGKWEAAGGMWVEADCNLSSGESLVRQLLFGTRFFEREFGKKCEYLWLPDVFGYSWALP